MNWIVPPSDLHRLHAVSREFQSLSVVIEGRLDCAIVARFLRKNVRALSAGIATLETDRRPMRFRQCRLALTKCAANLHAFVIAVKSEKKLYQQGRSLLIEIMDELARLEESACRRARWLN
jgi:hypothetical protein